MGRPSQKLTPFSNLKSSNSLKPKKNTSFKRKKFLFHGRVIHLQGHENYGLRDIMKKFDMSLKDIVYKASEMPKIVYLLNGSFHKYIPDFWIPDRNLIVEIKSKYTFEQNYQINILKAMACVDAGYDFETWIYNRKGILEHVLTKSVFTV